jgi:hypothetical protein
VSIVRRHLLPHVHFRLDVSHHSHEIGITNLPFTRRGRKAAVQLDKERVKRGVRQSDLQDHSASAASPSTSTATNQFSSAVSMLAPLPVVQPQHTFSAPPQQFQMQPIPPQDSSIPERWDRMAVLFHSVREHARGFDYPGSSVAALESVLIRLYLESPIPLMQNGAQVPEEDTTAERTTAEQQMNGET